MSNTIQIKDNKVIKTFGSRMNFVRESRIYDRIKGLGLAPEITGSWDGALEHEYVDGDSFADIMRSAFSNPYDFVTYSELFFAWYKKFRETVNMSLGDMDFSDFILTSNGELLCIDFEHCKPAGLEQDIANLAAVISFDDGNYAAIALENAKIFVKKAKEELDISSEKLYSAMKEAFERKCGELGIPSMKEVNEYMASFVCCSFVHSPRSGEEMDDMLSALEHSDQMFILFADDMSANSAKQVRYLLSVDKEDCDSAFLTEKGEIIQYPLLLKTQGAHKVLQQAKEFDMGFKEALMLNLRCKGCPIEKM